MKNKETGKYVDLYEDYRGPMGVSQWRNYGKKYHYDEFFKIKLLDQVEEIVEKAIGVCHGGGNGKRLLIQIKDRINKLKQYD